MTHRALSGRYAIEAEAITVTVWSISMCRNADAPGLEEGNWTRGTGGGRRGSLSGRPPSDDAVADICQPHVETSITQ